MASRHSRAISPSSEWRCGSSDSFDPSVSTVALLLIVDAGRLNHGLDHAGLAAQICRHAVMTDRRAGRNSEPSSPAWKIGASPRARTMPSRVPASSQNSSCIDQLPCSRGKSTATAFPLKLPSRPFPRKRSDANRSLFRRFDLSASSERKKVLVDNKPVGRAGIDFQCRVFLMSFDDSIAKSAIGTIWSPSPLITDAGISTFSGCAPPTKSAAHVPSPPASVSPRLSAEGARSWLAMPPT